MQKRSDIGMYTKKVVCGCLLFGSIWCGCVKPTVQPNVTQTPQPLPTSAEKLTLPPVTEEPDLTATKPVVEPTRIPATDITKPVLSPTEAPTVTKPVLSPTGSPDDGGQPGEPTAVITPGVTTDPTGEIEYPDVTQPGTEPTAFPSPVITAPPEATGTPMPTSLPDYTALLQSGWQRTEDFFGNRELFFSGKFNHTELLVEEGRYEYRYMVGGDESVLLCVIGEENKTIQPFLDELVQKGEGCIIVSEGENDYSYTYVEENRTIKGRIYLCNGARMGCMRVELSYSMDEIQAEGYDFYLR